jgi:hypothetical protein
MDLSVFLAILLILTFIGVGIYLIVMALTAGRRTRQNVTWPSVKGKVLAFEVVESSGITPEGSPFSTFKPVIRFIYTVNGTEYTSIQIGQAARAANDPITLQMADHFPVGRKVKVFFDPQNPSEAILSPQIPVAKPVLTAGIVILLIGLLTACFGGLGFLVYFFTH